MSSKRSSAELRVSILNLGRACASSPSSSGRREKLAIVASGRQSEMKLLLFRSAVVSANESCGLLFVDPDLDELAQIIKLDALDFFNLDTNI